MLIKLLLSTHLLLKNSQLKEADDQLTGSFAATTAESKLSELCIVTFSYIFLRIDLRKENEIPLFRKFPFS